MRRIASGRVPLRPISAVFALGLVLAGCGGGGGGRSITYDGLTSQATVTNGNAAALSGGAYRSGDAGTSVSSPIPIAAVASATTPASARSVRVATAVHDALAKIDMLGSGAVHASGAVAQNSFTGTCGGNASYSVTYNDTTGSFSGNLNFNGYCESGETISGSMSFSGLLDIATGLFNSFEIGVNNLSVSNGSDSFAIAGSIAFSFPTSTSMSVTETFNIRDASGTVYRVENFVVSVNTDLEEVEFSGRFYHPDHGYVVVATAPAFHVPSGSSTPTSGSMTITGASSSARLTANADGTYLLEIDTDGIPGYESSQSDNWTSL